MDTIELTLTIPRVEHAPFLAELEEPATGFVQNDTELRAYVPAERWAAVDQKQLKARLAADGHPDALSIRPLESKNWNAVWEDTLSPVRAGPFLVCPTSVDPPSVRDDATVLRIDPEMSFGTATTRLRDWPCACWPTPSPPAIACSTWVPGPACWPLRPVASVPTRHGGWTPTPTRCATPARTYAGMRRPTV
jgi:Ribosomal protein L11 methylase